MCVYDNQQKHGILYLKEQSYPRENLTFVKRCRQRRRFTFNEESNEEGVLLNKNLKETTQNFEKWFEEFHLCEEVKNITKL